MDSQSEASPAGWIARVVYTGDGEQVRTVWRVVLPLVVGTVVYFGAYAVGPVLIRAILGTDVTGTTATVGALAVFLVIAAGVCLGTVAVGWLVTWLDRRGAIWEAFAVSSAWGRDFVGGIGIGAVASVAAIVVLAFRGPLTLDIGVYGVGTESVGLGMAAVSVLLVFVLANNVFEEVLFREIVLRQTARGVRSRKVPIRWAAVVALVVSTVIFGAFHLFARGIAGAVTSGVGGILFGVAYLVSGRLALPIGVHFGGAAFSAIVREELGDGLMLPTVLRAEFSAEQEVFIGTELWLVRVLVGVGLILLWVYLWEGDVGIHERVYRIPGK